MSPQRLAWCLAVWLYAAPGQAASLRWDAPPDCPSSATIEAQIERSIGRPLREVYGVDFEVQIVRAAPHTWTLTLRTRSRTPESDVRERELVGQTCHDVSDAAAVVITLTISERAAAHSGDDDVASESGQGVPDTAELAEPRANVRRAAPSSVVAEDPDEPPPSAAGPIPLEFSASLGVVLDSAILPSIAAGGSLEIAMRYGLLRVIALGALFADQEHRLKDGRGGRFGLALAGGLLCLQPSAEAVLMLGCAGFELGKVSAEGILGSGSTLRGSAPLRAVRLEVGGGYHLSPRIAAFLRLGVSIPISEADFNVDRDVTVHRLGPTSGRALAGIELSL